MKNLFFTVLFIFSSVSFADSNYYPEQFIKEISSPKFIEDQSLKDSIFNVLISNHQKSPKGERDTLGCQTPGVDNCYAQRNLGYDGARRILFGKIHLVNDGKSTYIRDVYCHKNFGPEVGVGQNQIPKNESINCEHTWPQSKFSSKFPKDIQKADLHHLFPTDSKANSVRGNFNFAEISHDNGELQNCEASRSGSSVTSGGDNYFEPPTEHKGNVARALFYFSVRYKISIPSNEEEVLRKWHQLDPVDDAEMERNNQVYFHQGNRNPFVDFPELVNSINKF